VVLQEQIEREAEPALGEAARAAMAGRAAVGKQLWRRLVLVEILRDGCRAAQRGHDGNDKKTAGRFR
jgi:hypothetical protein